MPSHQLFLQLVLDAIGLYKKKKGAVFKPCFYELLSINDVESLSINYKRVVSALKRDVRHRFLSLNNQESALYDYVSSDDSLVFDTKTCGNIAAYQSVLNESILFRWTQVIEDFNRSTPRIASKLKIKRDCPPTRGSLSKFKKSLLLENPNRACSRCNKAIEEDSELSIDHVIPWSFLYSDDIWNIALAHKSCNSSKGNIIPSQLEIEEQLGRNDNLLTLLVSAKESGKIRKELEFACSEDLLSKMWRIYAY